MQTGLIQDVSPEFDSAALGSTANMKIDTGGGTRRIYSLMLKLVATKTAGTIKFEDLVESLSVLVDGKVKMSLDPTLARRLDIYLNTGSDPMQDDVFVVPFTRPGYPGSSWGTGDIQTLMVKAKIVNALPGDYTALTRIKGQLAYQVLDKPEPRGAVFLESFVNQNPVAGWNTIDDLPIDSIAFLSRMLFDHAAITEVEVKVRDEVVYHMEKWAAWEAVNRNGIYKNGYNNNTLTAGDFPAFFDVLGDPGRFVSLVENNVRKTVKVRYYLDTGIAAASAFKIAVEGVEPGSQQAFTKAA